MPSLKTRHSVSALLAVLKACSSSRELETGRRIHQAVLDSGYENNMYIASSLVYMYGKCGSMFDAHRVFDSMLCHDLVSWSALVLGYAENGQELLALDIFASLRLRPNGRVFVSAVKACRNLAAKHRLMALERGMAVHSMCVSSEIDIFVTNALVDMYAKCGSLVDARHVLDTSPRHNVVTWTSMLLGYVENDEEYMALELFSEIQSLGVSPDALTFYAAVNACTGLAMKETGHQVNGALVKQTSLEKGMSIHSLAASYGHDTDRLISNSLVDMYAKCGSMFHAQTVFDRILHKDVVSYTSLMNGYARNGRGGNALDIFTHMHAHCVPNTLTYVAALGACGTLAALEAARAIHADGLAFVCDTDVDTKLLQSSLVDVYGKCGSVCNARMVFDLYMDHDSVTWSTLMSGYARQGVADEVMSLFHRMQEEGIEPDGIAFLSVLIVCSHVGLVEYGSKLFDTMCRIHNIVPSVEHYHCMIDMYGRANQMQNAVEMASSMAGKANTVTWLTVLAACRKWKDVVTGRLAFECVMKMDETNVTAYSLMSALYGSLCMWEEHERLEQRRNTKSS